MILFAFREHESTDLARDRYDIRAYRWTLQVELGIVQISHQYKHEDKWYDGGGYYAACLTKHFALGRDHAYYDGPHDLFSIGWLHFSWQGDWCQKCYDAA